MSHGFYKMYHYYTTALEMHQIKPHHLLCSLTNDIKIIYKQKYAFQLHQGDGCFVVMLQYIIVAETLKKE
jgi:hypothetical protein